MTNLGSNMMNRLVRSACRMGRAKRAPPFLSLVVALCAVSAADQLRAQSVPGEQAQLIAVVQSESPAAEKVKACKRLASIGDASSIPALAPLLTDEQLSHPARLALEAIPDPAAGAALVEALPKVQQRLLIGVINSLGARREAAAATELARIAAGGDPQAAAAAATALGKIGTPEAADALTKLLPDAPAEVRAAVAGGCLASAESLIDNGQRDRAAAIYDLVRQSDLPMHIRMAGLRGAILAREASGADLLAAAAQSADAAEFAVALEVSRQVKGAEPVAKLLAVLPSLSPDRQALVIAALGDRHEAAARPAVLAAARSGDPVVRAAAIRALAGLGNASAVEILLEAAASGDAGVAAAARDSLVAMPGAEVDAAIVAALDKAQGAPRALLIDLVGRRGITSAVSALGQAAEETDPAMRLAAIRALGRTVEPAQLAPLTDRLAAPANAEEAAAIREALRDTCVRVADREACAQHLARIMSQASPADRSLMIGMMGVLGGPTALATVAAAATDANVEIQDAATRVLGEWMTPDAAPVLLTVAKSSANNKFRIRALRGYIRIVRQLDVADAERIVMCREAMSLATRDEERARVLGALGRIASAEALAMVRPYLQTPSLKEAASAAAVAIGENLVATQPAVVAETMPLVLQATGDAGLVQRANDVLAAARQASKQ